MKHTPGPWKAECPICEGDTMQVRDIEGRRIAIVKGLYPMGTKTEDANARLIAAAPELLSLVKKLANCATFRNGEIDCYCAPNKADMLAAKKLIETIENDR